MIRQTVGLPQERYDILIEDGLLGRAALELEPYTGEHGPVAVVTDEQVFELYGRDMEAALQAAGIDAHAVVIPPGEQSKSIDGLVHLYDAFADMKLKRSSLAIALGGGVVGDLCGFAAATYMRGIPYIQIPTTLLAQVDSSVGGKTAIDLAQGKNMAGAFYQPRLVLIDPVALKTLPERELGCGMAEVIKYGAIRSRSLFEDLRGRLDEEELTKIIGACCRIKGDIVERDERDTGERMFLNFGHTFGHAIEKACNYKTYNHGEAVAIGMALAAELGERMELTEQGTTEELKNMLTLHGLETSCPCPPSDLLPLLEADKKGETGGVRMVILRKIGESFIHKMSFAELEFAVKRMEG